MNILEVKDLSIAYQGKEAVKNPISACLKGVRKAKERNMFINQ